MATLLSNEMCDVELRDTCKLGVFLGLILYRKIALSQIFSNYK